MAAPDTRHGRVVYVRLDEDAHREMRLYLAHNDMSISDFVRRAIELYMDSFPDGPP